MQYRTLGRSGLEVSLVGIGLNNFGGRIPDLKRAQSLVDKAVELGINSFDTADIYGGGGKSEEFLGATMGDKRKRIVLATKFGKLPDAVAGVRGTRAYIAKAVDASLKRMKTDWIDLYYMHEPDPQTPIEETLGALDALTKAGKIRHAASSNFSPAQLDEAVAAAKKLGVAGFVAAQDEYSLLVRGIETGLLQAIGRGGLGLVPYFPLAAGALTGKYRKGAPPPEGSRVALNKGSYDRYVTPESLDKVEKLRAFVEARGRTLLELAMSWLARRPNVASIIAGASWPDQLEANVKATEWELSEAEIAEVDRLTA